MLLLIFGKDMDFNDYVCLFENSIHETISELDINKIHCFTNNLLNHQRVFLLGRGRTGLIMDMFAMRLMHLGFQAYSIGKPTTPRVERTDLVVLASGSGETKGILIAAEKARDIGATIIVFSANENSSIYLAANENIQLNQKESITQSFAKSKVLTGTLFEQALFILFECIIGLLMEETNQTYTDLSARHANFE